MKQEDILKAIEDMTAIVASLSGNAVVVGLAISSIKGVIGMVVGQSLEGPEYAAAVQRGYERNKKKIGDRIESLED